MPVVTPPPIAMIDPVTDILHGVPITDPYRWLEDQNSRPTRAWIEEQTLYARAYLEDIPGRDRMRERVRALLDVEACDSFLKAGYRYFFRKRLPGEEQPSIYFREGPDGRDQLLIDPAARGTGNYTAVKPLTVSPDGRLLLYQVKQGGERTGTFEIFDVLRRRSLRDSLPRGFLRGFVFAADSKSFYYVHDPNAAEHPFHHAAFHHVLGTSFAEDREVFSAGDDQRFRLVIIPGSRNLGLLVYRFLDKLYTDFYLLDMSTTGPPITVLQAAEYHFQPQLLDGRILAMTDQNAPNRRIVEVQPRNGSAPFLCDLISEDNRRMIRSWVLTINRIWVSYAQGATTQVEAFDHFGKRQGEISAKDQETIRVLASATGSDELLLERESFIKPKEISRYSPASGAFALWSQRGAAIDAHDYVHTEVTFPSKDGTRIPMFLVGKRETLIEGIHPLIMTAYGGFGVPMTPQFSVLVAILIERGCLFALPNIRGGSEFGANWHNSARRRSRQIAFDDFLAAAEWLIEAQRTTAARFGIFGGSNSGLLVAAALTQRPELFRAALCMVPMADMLRYHLFDNAHVWKAELGSAEDRQDFLALLGYSPYHRVRQDTAYPAVMVVSGDADQNCNPLHARKLTAQLQASNTSDHPILLDYDVHRGHSPVLPLAARMDALVNRLAFLSHELGVAL